MEKRIIQVAVRRIAERCELTPKQEKLDINEDGKIDGEDLKKVREGETANRVISAGSPVAAAVKELKAAYKGVYKINVAKMTDELVSEGYTIGILTNIAGRLSRLAISYQIYTLVSKPGKIAINSDIGLIDKKKENGADLSDSGHIQFGTPLIKSSNVQDAVGKTDKLIRSQSIFLNRMGMF